MDLSRRNVTRSESGSPAHVSFRDIVRNKGLLKRIPYYLNCRLICTSLKIYMYAVAYMQTFCLVKWMYTTCYSLDYYRTWLWLLTSFFDKSTATLEISRTWSWNIRQGSTLTLHWNLIAALDYNSNCERFKKKRWLLEVIWFSMLKLFNLKLIQRAKNKINPKSKN